MTLLSAAIILPLLLSSQAASAEGTSTKHGAGYGEPAVVLGADAGLAFLTSGARSQTGGYSPIVVHVHGGYRLSGGVEPELSFSSIRFRDRYGSIPSLAPGCRWWIPVNGPVQPWIGGHLGVMIVETASGDVVDQQTYWSLDAGGGVAFMLARYVGVGTSFSWAYGDIINRPREQPVPPGYAGTAETTSYSLSWMTMRAGLVVFL
jgi:hypothetical protein